MLKNKTQMAVSTFQIVYTELLAPGKGQINAPLSSSVWEKMSQCKIMSILKSMVEIPRKKYCFEPDIVRRLMKRLASEQEKIRYCQS
jgi:hypothetical protein